MSLNKKKKNFKYRYTKVIKEAFFKGYNIPRICLEPLIRYKHKTLPRTYVVKVLKHLGLYMPKEKFRDKIKLITEIDPDNLDLVKDIIGLKNYQQARESTIAPLIKGALNKNEKFNLLNRLKKFPDEANIKIFGEDTSIHHTVLWDARQNLKHKNLTKRE